MKIAHKYPNTDVNRPFTEDEIMYCIENLKNNKAAGEDVIINEFLKTTSDTLINVYVKLFNIVLNTGIDYSHIVLIIAIWPGDRIRRPEHSTVEHGSCDESV